MIEKPAVQDGGSRSGSRRCLLLDGHGKEPESAGGQGIEEDHPARPKVAQGDEEFAYIDLQCPKHHAEVPREDR